MQVLLQTLEALQHYVLVFPEKGGISDPESDVHSTDPDSHFAHKERITIFFLFVSVGVVSKILVLLLCKFEIEIWVCQLIQTLVSHQVSPRSDNLTLSVLFGREVIVKSDEHDQIPCSSHIGKGVFSWLFQVWGIGLSGGNFYILEEGSQQFEEQVIELIAVRVDDVEYFGERIVDVPDLVHKRIKVNLL